MEAAAHFPDEELLKLGRVVCQITTIDSEEKDSKPGTGFYCGFGWVMSNANVFQDVEDNNTMRSKISSVTFSFLKGGEVENAKCNSRIIRPTAEHSVVFERHIRIAYIHHVPVNPVFTPGSFKHNIAMIKLGKQFKCGQAEGDLEPDSWEKDEEELLVELNPSDFADFPSPLLVGEEVYGIHFGVGDNEEKFVRSKIIPITQTTIFTVTKFDNSKNTFDPLASSGCPVIIQRDGKYRLAGLNFGMDSTGYALMWTKDIQGHIGHQVGASIISMFQSYFAQKGAEKNMIDQVSHDREKRLQEAKDRQLSMKVNLIEETSQSMELHDQKAEDKKVAIFHDKGKEALVKIAREYQLTIYLPDGEIIGKEDPAVE